MENRKVLMVWLMNISSIGHIYLLLFNIILDKGIIPESWGKGIVLPIFKNKGSKSDPNSNRGVTLNSCISKNVFCGFK
jgi:hypothetical protein